MVRETAFNALSGSRIESTLVIKIVWKQRTYAGFSSSIPPRNDGFVRRLPNISIFILKHYKLKTILPIQNVYTVANSSTHVTGVPIG